MKLKIGTAKAEGWFKDWTPLKDNPYWDGKPFEKPRRKRIIRVVKVKIKEIVEK